MRKTFEKDFMLEVLWEDRDDAEIILDVIDGNSRWSLEHRFIFTFEGKFWETSYRTGATEQQDETPWQYDDSVECWEVVPVEKIVIDYVEVK